MELSRRSSSLLHFWEWRSGHHVHAPSTLAQRERHVGSEGCKFPFWHSVTCVPIGWPTSGGLRRSGTLEVSVGIRAHLEGALPRVASGIGYGQKRRWQLPSNGCPAARAKPLRAIWVHQLGEVVMVALRESMSGDRDRISVVSVGLESAIALCGEVVILNKPTGSTTQLTPYFISPSKGIHTLVHHLGLSRTTMDIAPVPAAGVVLLVQRASSLHLGRLPRSKLWERLTLFEGFGRHSISVPGGLVRQQDLILGVLVQDLVHGGQRGLAMCHYLTLV